MLRARVVTVMMSARLPGLSEPNLVIDPHRTRTVDGAEFEHAPGGELEFVERARVLGIAHIAHHAE